MNIYCIELPDGSKLPKRGYGEAEDTAREFLRLGDVDYLSILDKTDNYKKVAYGELTGWDSEKNVYTYSLQRLES